MLIYLMAIPDKLVKKVTIDISITEGVEVQQCAEHDIHVIFSFIIPINSSIALTHLRGFSSCFTNTTFFPSDYINSIYILKPNGSHAQTIRCNEILFSIVSDADHVLKWNCQTLLH